MISEEEQGEPLLPEETFTQADKRASAISIGKTVLYMYFG